MRTKLEVLVRLSVVLLLVSGIVNLLAWIPSLPYAYFEVLRMVTFASSVLLLVLYFRIGWWSLVIGFFVAVIDNPIVVFHFGRQVWNGIDALIGIYCLSMSLTFVIRLVTFYRSHDIDMAATRGKSWRRRIGQSFSSRTTSSSKRL